MRDHRAFTLVELIVVIVILGVLATIAFLAFASYQSGARDSTRLSDMSLIVHSLDLFSSRSGVFPEPEDGVGIAASGQLIGLQWAFWWQNIRRADMGGAVTDPLDGTAYTYLTHPSRTQYQLTGFLEAWDSHPLGQVMAMTPRSSRYLVSRGTPLGVLLREDSGIPLERLMLQGVVEVSSGSVDNSPYRVIFSHEASATGQMLISSLSLYRPDELTHYDDSLVGYWDMESVFSSGGKSYLRDLSRQNSSGELIGYSSLANAFVPGVYGQALALNGTGQYVKVANNPRFDFNGQDFTILMTYRAPVIQATSSYQLTSLLEKWEGSGKYPFTLRIVNQKNTNPADVGQIRLNRYESAGKTGGATSYGRYNVDMFTQVAVLKRSGDLSLYANGTLDSFVTRDYAVSTSNGHALFIGSRNGAYPFVGVIDEVRIYDRALSDAEIALFARRDR